MDWNHRNFLEICGKQEKILIQKMDLDEESLIKLLVHPKYKFISDILRFAFFITMLNSSANLNASLPLILFFER